MEAADSFAALGGTLPEALRLFIRDSVSSTNDEIRLLGRNGAADGSVLIAEHQSAGRGRRGATWFSPPGESLAFSLLVRPSEPIALWPRLALAAGVAVAEAIESFGLAAGIKWPNDVWIGRRKVAGILVEADRDFAIVGIGINVNCHEFPQEVAATASSLALEKGAALSRPAVLDAVLRRLEIRRRQIGAEFPALLAAVRVRCVLTGNPVTLTTSAGPKSGTAEGIGNSGELLLRTTAGLEPILQADEIRLA